MQNKIRNSKLVTLKKVQAFSYKNSSITNYNHSLSEMELLHRAVLKQGFGLEI